MVNKKRILILAIISIVCILICTALFCLFYEKVNKYEYADTSFFEMVPNLTSEEEKLNSPIEYKKEYLSIYSHYYFDESTNENNRNKFVTRTENILKYLSKNNYLAFEDKITCHLSDKLFNTYSQKKVYMTIDYKPMDLMICLLQSQHIDYLPYGFYYGVANEICKDLGYNDFELKSDRLALVSYYKKTDKIFYGINPNLDTLDLEYPLFSPIYSDKNTLKKSRGTAVQLVDYTYKQNKLDKITDVLSFVTTDNMAALTNDWLHNKLKIDKSRTEYMGLKYFANSYNYTLNVKSNWFDMYFSNDFYEPDMGEDFKINYSNIKFTLSENETSAAIIRSELNLSENFITTVIFNRYYSGYYGRYHGGFIEVLSLTAFSHEYTHACIDKVYSITFGTHFSEEGLPTLYQAKYDNLYKISMFLRYKMVYAKAAPQYFEHSDNIRKLYNKVYTEADFDTFNLNGYIHANWYMEGQNINTGYLDMGYNSSLMLYIEEIYGFSGCIKLIEKLDTQKALGLTDYQLLNDWWNYLVNKFEYN